MSQSSHVSSRRTPSEPGGVVNALRIATTASPRHSASMGDAKPCATPTRSSTHVHTLRSLHARAAQRLNCDAAAGFLYFMCFLLVGAGHVAKTRTKFHSETVEPELGRFLNWR